MSSILLVDDDPNNLLLLEELLLSEGYSTLSATSGSEALTLAKTSNPCLILLDVMMPDMDGFEVCRQLRQDRQLQATPIIFLTALDDDSSRLKGLEMMGDDYLTKPINSQLLLTKVKSLLRLNQMRSQAARRENFRQTRHQIAAAWKINEHLSEKFRLFVPEQFLNRIAPEGLDSIQLGNIREEKLTILFCDIRSFTAIAERQTAKETLQWLNAFFTRMSNAIDRHHGFIDKFLGDAIMAVFDRSEHHVSDALFAAIAMVGSLDEFNACRGQYNLEQSVRIGIGIHSGLGAIGTIGSRSRMDSTVIGDVVNTAARLEELTKTHRCSIIASGDAIAQFHQNQAELPAPALPFEFVRLDTVAPRGKQQALEIYEVRGCTQPLPQ